MRSTILSIPLLVAMSAAAAAQGTSPAYPPPSGPPPQAMPEQPPPMPPPGNLGESGETGAMDRSEPLSGRAANINQQDQEYQKIAPALPSPLVSEDAGPVAYLQAAQSALAAGRTGEAQQSLEMAQTRLLDRSVPYGQTNAPINTPAIDTISKALQALGAHDRAQAMQLIQAAIPQAQAAMR